MSIATAFVRLQNLISVLRLNATFVRYVLDQRSSLYRIQCLCLFVSCIFSILERLASCSNLKHLRRRCSNRARRRCLSQKVLFFFLLLLLYCCCHPTSSSSSTTTTTTTTMQSRTTPIVRGKVRCSHSYCSHFYNAFLGVGVGGVVFRSTTTEKNHDYNRARVEKTSRRSRPGVGGATSRFSRSLSRSLPATFALGRKRALDA